MRSDKTQALKMAEKNLLMFILFVGTVLTVETLYYLAGKTFLCEPNYEYNTLYRLSYVYQMVHSVSVVLLFIGMASSIKSAREAAAPANTDTESIRCDTDSIEDEEE